VLHNFGQKLAYFFKNCLKKYCALSFVNAGISLTQLLTISKCPVLSGHSVCMYERNRRRRWQHVRRLWLWRRRPTLITHIVISPIIIIISCRRWHGSSVAAGTASRRPTNVAMVLRLLGHVARPPVWTVSSACDSRTRQS